MQKTINGVAFEISAPYAEGHALSEAEAKVLNQVRSENIGNNLREKLKKAAEEGASIEALQATVAELDASYVFNMRTASASAKLDPYEKEAIKIARELLKAHLANSGRKLTVAPEGLTEDEWNEKIDAEVERIAGSDKVVAAAKKAVDAKRKQADSLMESLGDVTV